MSVQKQSTPSPAAAVWPWREAGRPAPAATSHRRRQAGIESLVGFAAGVTFLLIWKEVWLGTAVLAIAAAILFIGLFLPSAHASFLRGRQVLVKGVGNALTWILLAPFFYICFTAGRLMQLVMRKDPLCLAFPTKLTTYWVKRKTAGGVERYRRQY
jgi:hypothetical protein